MALVVGRYYTMIDFGSKVNDCLFHENVVLLSTYNLIVIPIKYRNFGAFIYESAEKQMLNAISLVIEQRKNEFDWIAKVRFSPIYLYALRG